MPLASAATRCEHENVHICLDDVFDDVDVIFDAVDEIPGKYKITF